MRCASLARRFSSAMRWFSSTSISFATDGSGGAFVGRRFGGGATMWRTPAMNIRSQTHEKKTKNEIRIKMKSLVHALRWLCAAATAAAVCGESVPPRGANPLARARGPPCCMALRGGGKNRERRHNGEGGGGGGDAEFRKEKIAERVAVAAEELQEKLKLARQEVKMEVRCDGGRPPWRGRVFRTRRPPPARRCSVLRAERIVCLWAAYMCVRAGS